MPAANYIRIKDRMTLTRSAFFWNHAWVSWSPKSCEVLPHLSQLSPTRSTFSSVDLLAPDHSVSWTYGKYPGSSITKKFTVSASKQKPKEKKPKAWRNVRTKIIQDRCENEVAHPPHILQIGECWRLPGPEQVSFKKSTSKRTPRFALL